MARSHIGELPPGARGRVVGYGTTARRYARRLLAMGLVPESEFTVVRRASLGDPIEISVSGALLSLRADEVACVEIEVTP